MPLRASAATSSSATASSTYSARAVSTLVRPAPSSRWNSSTASRYGTDGMFASRKRLTSSGSSAGADTCSQVGEQLAGGALVGLQGRQQPGEVAPQPAQRRE